MKCQACYGESTNDFCPACRKRLFGKARVGGTLAFAAPDQSTLPAFQAHTKQLSISGMQLKYSLCLQNNALRLCDTGGSYILKPVPTYRYLTNVEAAPANEHLTMQLASRVFGISTAPNALLYFAGGQPAYLVKRFDVKPDGSRYLMEDFAQITGRSRFTHGAEFKYAGSYEEIGTLIKQYVAASMPALERFFQLIVFNYAVCNGDAHLRNFSLLRTDDGEYALVPAYDLMSTVLHTPNESDTALDLYPDDISENYSGTNGHYGRSSFLELARRLGIVPARAARILNRFLDAQTEVEQLVGQSFLHDTLRQVYLKNYEERISRLKEV